MTYEIVIASIFRNSAGYIDRYMEQVAGVLQMSRASRVVWLEGDSEDNTMEELVKAANLFEADYGTEVTILELDTGEPQWPSVDHPARWRHMEMVWNACLEEAQRYPAEICVSVESDLIWTAEDVFALARQVEADRADVAYARLMKRAFSAVNFDHFYDTHAFTVEGGHFVNAPPFFPAGYNGPTEGLIEVQSGGGLVVTKWEWWEGAKWANGCVLRFDPAARLRLDMGVEIWHP